MTQKPIAGYRRLSVDRHGNKIGYEVQTDTSELWAQGGDRKLVIGEWYEDKDKTAADEAVYREGFQRMLADVERGLWGGIVVWRVDRLVRIRYEWEQVLRLVKSRGGFIAQSIDGMTTETDEGESMLSLQVAFGDHEVRGMKKRIRANSAKRAEKGAYNGGGRRPFGFEAAIHDPENPEIILNSGKIGIEHVPDEVTLLQDAARRIAWESETYSDVIRDWHGRAKPVYGATGAPWNPKTLQTILTSYRMIGKRLAAGEPVAAKWAPILDVATWERLRTMTTVGVAKAPRESYLLSSRIFCQCGQPMTGATRKYKKGGDVVPTRTYRCKSGPADQAKGSCGSCNVIAEPAEMVVLARVFVRMVETRGMIEGTAAGESDLVSEIERLEAEIDSDNAQLTELAGEWGAKRLTTGEWMAAKAPINGRIEAHQGQVDGIKARLTVPTPSGEEWRDLPAWFQGLTFGQQRRAVQHAITRVEVLAPGRSGRYFDKRRIVVTPTDSKKAS